MDDVADGLYLIKMVITVTKRATVRVKWTGMIAQGLTRKRDGATIEFSGIGLLQDWAINTFLNVVPNL